MVIGFVTAGLRFNGGTRTSLGGSETALLNMAKSMAKRGHEVVVFCACDQPGSYDGVNYFDVDTFKAFASTTVFDVLVVSRWVEFLSARTTAHLRVLWLHDTLVDNARVMQNLWQTDMIMALSDFHIENYTGEGCLPELKSHIWKTSNGVDMGVVKANIRPKIKNKLIYTSRPERGLHFLLGDVFPRILSKIPDAKLYYANYDISQLRQLPEQVAAIIQTADMMAKRLGDKVVPLGHLGKEELYQHISSSEILLYPTNFNEISCAAAGTRISMPCDRSKYPYGVPIEELEGKSNFPVYAYDSIKDEFVLETCKKVWKTGENRECVDITLDDDSILTVTPEHLVMNFDGEYVRADSLKPGDRLNAMHMRYNVAFKQKNGQWWDEHRLTAEWAAGREVQKGEHVNHLDATRLDNSPGMLEILTAGDHHRKTHTGKIFSRRSQQKRLDSFAKQQETKKWKDNSAKRSEHGTRAGNKFWQEVYPLWSEEQKAEWIAARAKKTYIKNLANGTMDKLKSGSSEKGQRGARKFWKEIFPTWSTEKQKEWLNKRTKAMEIGRWNHFVVSVAKSKKTHTVYDMEVNRVHNFIAEGVVVHNCITAMEAQACGTPVITTDAFALPETLSRMAGLLIHGMPPETNYFNNFAEQTVKLLQDDRRRKEMSLAGPKAIIDNGYTWDQVAASWETKFQEVLEKRAQNKTGILHQLERSHDIRSAAVLARDWNHHDAERYTKLVDETEGKTGQNVNTLPQDIKEALPRFHRVLDLLKDEIDLTKPQQVLDFASGLVSFGLFVKKSAPNLHVTIVDKDQDVLNKLKEIATKAKLEITFALEIPKDATYDIIFAGNYLDTVRNPEFTIDKLSESVKEEGYLCWSTRFGPSTPVLPKNHDRIWNFYFSDFKKMFDSPPKFEGSFVETLTQACEDITGHWVCTLKVPYGKTIPLDLSARKLYTRPYQTIAACMIVKNEEDNITKCLKSIRKVVDKIYLTDTGSTDNTLELVKPYVDEIRHVEFEDFSQARNFSKEGVKESLIFWLDADEVLVGGEAIHKYLVSPIFNGWVLRQRHLMLDVNGTFDTPCRIFRNLSPYKFTGCVHEHGESTDISPYDSAIAPSIVLAGVDLAHYGYTNEGLRRNKCSNRNMKLLAKDVEENGKKGRMLTWVLVIRDYINMVQWAMGERGSMQLQHGSQEHILLNHAVATYIKYFADNKNRYSQLAFTMYQKSLELLGRSGLPFEFKKHPPFEVQLTLTGALGGLDPEKKIEPKSMWFIDDNQFMNFMTNQASNLVTQLGVADKSKYRKELKAKHQEIPFTSDPNRATELLALGTNVMPNRM